MTVAQVIALALVAVAGTAVTYTHDPLRQALASSVFGLSLAVAFLLLGAPGVAMAVIVVTAIALPVMVLFTLANTRGGER